MSSVICCSSPSGVNRRISSEIGIALLSRSTADISAANSASVQHSIIKRTKVLGTTAAEIVAEVHIDSKPVVPAHRERLPKATFLKNVPKGKSQPPDPSSIYLPGAELPSGIPAKRTDIGQQSAEPGQDGRRDAPHKLGPNPLDA